ncbi:hypothetical protein RUM43_008998 [Polyplax serrata]|uniref:Uncharacterized protein n=1 Tax=Polyplax serrata TaxID=468196 RepID=A0AAN8S0W2_POLSC
MNRTRHDAHDKTADAEKFERGVKTRAVDQHATTTIAPSDVTDQKGAEKISVKEHNPVGITSIYTHHTIYTVYISGNVSPADEPLPG